MGKSTKKPKIREIRCVTRPLLRPTLRDSAGPVTEAYRGPLVGVVRRQAPAFTNPPVGVKSTRTRPGNRWPKGALGVAALNRPGPKKTHFSAGRRCLRMQSVRIGMIATTSGADWPSVPRRAGRLLRPLILLRYLPVPSREHRSRTLCSVRMSSFRWWVPWGAPLVLAIAVFLARCGWGGSCQERRI